MGLNLFERGPLEQDTGLINERWNQDDSTPFSATGAAGTLHTVTAGKTAYVKTIVYHATSVGGTNFSLKDGGTTKGTYGQQSPYVTHPVNMDVPLEFSTSIVVTDNGGSNWQVTVTGWEE